LLLQQDAKLLLIKVTQVSVALLFPLKLYVLQQSVSLPHLLSYALLLKPILLLLQRRVQLLFLLLLLFLPWLFSLLLLQ